MYLFYLISGIMFPFVIFFQTAEKQNASILPGTLNFESEKPKSIREHSIMLVIDGQMYILEHATALRIPELFDGSKRMTRIIFSQKPFDTESLEDEVAFIKAFSHKKQKGVYLDIKDDGGIAAVRLNWKSYSHMWSGAVTELHFEGDIKSDRITGIVYTDPEMNVFRQEIKWSVSGEVDLESTKMW